MTILNVANSFSATFVLHPAVGLGEYLRVLSRLFAPGIRGVFFLVAVLIAGGLSYSGIQNARAMYFAGLGTREGYQRATQLEPSNARNWQLLGRYLEFSLEEMDAEGAIRAYQKALSLTPHSASVWLDLGVAYESTGDLVAARNAFLQAKFAHPISADVAWRYGNFLLRRGEQDAAFAEIRRALEADPKRGLEAFSRCLRAESDINIILDKAIPPIPEIYIDLIADQSNEGQTEHAQRVWERLVALHSQLRLEEAFPLVGALRAKGQIAEAHRVWDQAVVLSGKSDFRGSNGSVLWDGSFASGVSSGGFAWLFHDKFPGVEIDGDAKEKHSGNHSLRFVLSGRYDGYYAQVCQFVSVQPLTEYRFSGWVQMRTASNNVSFRFRLLSLRTQNGSTAETPEVNGNQPWTKIEMLWTPDKDVTEAQVCLVPAPGNPFNHEIDGTIWVDDVALRPKSGESSKLEH